MQVYDCTVSAGVATVTNELGLPVNVPDSVLMCSGALTSIGKLVISENGAFYIANTQPDLLFLLSEVVKIADQVSALSQSMVSRSPDSSPLSPEVTAGIEAIKATLTAKVLI